MSNKTYLDHDGLKYLWSKIKQFLADKASADHTHDEYQATITGTEGQIVGFDSTGAAVAQDHNFASTENVIVKGENTVSDAFSISTTTNNPGKIELEKITGVPILKNKNFILSVEHNLGGVRIYRDGYSTVGAFYIQPSQSGNAVYIKNDGNSRISLKSGSNDAAVYGIATPTIDSSAANKLYVDTAVGAKQDALTGTAGQIVGFDDSGNAVAQDMPTMEVPEHEHLFDRGVTTAGDGAAYTATVEGITALEAGLSFIMIPHTASTSQTATLNVNGLGAKQLRRPVSSNNTTTVANATTNWLYASRPVRVMYNGTFWIVMDMPRPHGPDIYGSVAIENGGTGATTAEAARTNLGLTTEEWTFTLEDGSTVTKAVYVG